MTRPLSAAQALRIREAAKQWAALSFDLGDALARERLLLGQRCAETQRAFDRLITEMTKKG